MLICVTERELPFVFGSTPGGVLASDWVESAVGGIAPCNGSGDHLTQRKRSETHKLQIKF